MCIAYVIDNLSGAEITIPNIDLLIWFALLGLATIRSIYKACIKFWTKNLDSHTEVRKIRDQIRVASGTRQ